MAYLTIKVLRESPGRIEAFVSKVANKLPFLLEREGGEKVFNKILFTRSGRILELTPSNKADFTRCIDLLRTADVQASKNIMLANDKERYALTDLLHTADFGGNTSRGGGKGNKGDMAEAIFAAAITARFISKNTSVTVSDVVMIIDLLNAQKQKQSLTFKSPNLNPKITDKVTYSVNLAPSNLIALTDKSRQAALGKIISASVKYANSTNVSELAKAMYVNGKYNDIQVICDGLGNQKGTKIDVRVIIDGKPTNINVSLKAGSGTKQFGQIGGIAFDKLQMLWKNLLNIDVKSAETDYNDMLKKHDEFGAAAVVYKKAADVFNANMQNQSSRYAMYNKIANGIKYYSTLHEKDVTMVHLTSSEAILYKFNNLEVLLHTVKLQAKMKSGKYPQLDFQDEKGNVLISVRVKYEKSKDYKRNYIEKGKLLTTLAGSIV